jgi:hypothetical protein
MTTRSNANDIARADVASGASLRQSGRWLDMFVVRRKKKGSSRLRAWSFQGNARAELVCEVIPRFF